LGGVGTNGIDAVLYTITAKKQTATALFDSNKKNGNEKRRKSVKVSQKEGNLSHLPFILNTLEIFVLAE
jgi:hypothetical protein